MVVFKRTKNVTHQQLRGVQADGRVDQPASMTPGIALPILLSHPLRLFISIHE